VTTTEQSKALDELAVKSYGLSGLILMENAARSVLDAILAFFPELAGGRKRIAILGGPGQNGGDGWALGRLFHNRGHLVHAFLFTRPGHRPKGDALVNLAILENLAIPFKTVSSFKEPPADFASYDLLVDALFGTGLSRGLEGVHLELVRHLNALPRIFKVAAVDLPSGLSGDSGEAEGEVLRADLTVSLGSYKRGFFQNRGPSLTGKLALGDIGLSPEMYEKIEPAGTFTGKEEVLRILPPRDRLAHKGVFGHAVVCGGSPGKSGALVLSALGAARAGAGLVTAAHPEGLETIMETKLTSAMTRSLPENRETRELDRLAAPFLLELLQGKDALALGPGLGLSFGARDFTKEIVLNAELPLVLDADSLTHLGASLEIVAERTHPTVLTPHPKEAAALLGTSAGEVLRDRFKAAEAIARLGYAVVILKGPHSIVMDPRGNFAVNSTGGPELATGGSGDILTGLVCGLLAQKIPPFEAARLAAWVHGRAGELAAELIGPFGMSAAEIQPCATKVWEELYRARGWL
jgi:NAD(P)H-hydrate epimerase